MAIGTTFIHYQKNGRLIDKYLLLAYNESGINPHRSILKDVLDYILSKPVGSSIAEISTGFLEALDNMLSVPICKFELDQLLQDYYEHTGIRFSAAIINEIKDALKDCVVNGYCRIDNLTNVEPITLVEVLDSISSVVMSNVSGSSNVYADYTGIPIPVNAGDTYTFKVEGDTNGNFYNSITIFIDWDNDGILNDRYEIGNLYDSTGQDGKSVFKDIVIPTTATGNVRMRVIKSFSKTSPDSACEAATSYGQYQDYTLTIP